MQFFQVCLLTLATTLVVAKDGQDDGPNHGHGNDDIPGHHVSFSSTTIYSSKIPIATIPIPVFEDNPSRTNDDHPHTAIPTGTITPSPEDNPSRTKDDHPHTSITLGLPIVTPSTFEDNTKPGTDDSTKSTGIEDNTKSSTDDNNSIRLPTSVAATQSNATPALVTSSRISTSLISSSTTGTAARSTSSSTTVPANAAGSVDASPIGLFFGIWAAVAWIV